MSQTTQVKDLKPNPKNPRTISDTKLSMLKKAMAEFGDLSGIVYNATTKQLVGGHQRLKIIPKDAEVHLTKIYKTPTALGTVAEGYVEWNGERFKYRKVKWDEFKEKAANIAANKGAGEWDLSLLSDWMKDLDSFNFDLDLTLFSEDEREGFLREEPKANSGQCDEDEVPTPPKKAKSKPGQVYQLGKHRLMCGDSTDLEQYKKLFGSERADITFTSPPYNANTKQMQNGKAMDLYETYSDDLPSDEYVRFASTVLTNCIAFSREFVFWNVNYNSNSRSEFIKQIVPHLDLLDETIAWKKNALPVPYGLTRTWEPIFVFKCHKDKKRISELATHDTEFNYWEISNAGALDDSHRAAFPVALPEKAIALVKQAKSCFDPFGGSGTTLIACEKLGKQCFMMELDPIYIDVIIARYEKFTGDKAVLIN